MDLYKELENSFQILEKLFTKENLLEFKNTPVSNLYFYHFGLGTWIRNNLLYPKESVLHNLFFKIGLEHYDDISFFIIKLFHNYITNKI